MRRFLWRKNNSYDTGIGVFVGKEDCKISVNREKLKKYVRKLYINYPFQVLFEEINQNFIYVTNEDGDELGSISWVKEL